MKIKAFAKKIISLTPKFIFNFFAGICSNNKIEKEDFSLESFYPDNGGTCYKKESALSNEFDYDLQIIVPCYNAQRYLEKCLRSIINQKTSYKILLVLVDDGSTDDTGTILDEYSGDNIVVYHTTNGGPSSARNKGLETIKARYIAFVDSDDYLLEDTAIQTMMDTVSEIDREGNKIAVQFEHTSKDIPYKKRKAGYKQVDYLELNGFAWAKIYSSKIFEHITFPQSYWFEDTIISMIVNPMADICYKSKYCSYFYRDNNEGITSMSKSSPKTMDTFYVTRRVLEEREEYFKLAKDNLFYKKVFLQIVCNCVRLINYPANVQIEVFFETRKLLNNYDIGKLCEFRVLYNSIVNRQFKKYIRFCKLYSKFYLNV